MEDENKDLSTSQDTQVNEADDQQQDDTQDELTTLKAEVEKLKKAKSDQEQRAKIAEDKLKKASAPVQKKEDISQTDVIALIRANVHDDDMDTVKRFAKVENISLAEALKHDELKAVLKVREEKRKTAEATSTGKSPRGSSQVSDEVILEKAYKGSIPEKGSKEAEQLFWARRGGKK